MKATTEHTGPSAMAYVQHLARLNEEREELRRSIVSLETQMRQLVREEGINSGEPPTISDWIDFDLLSTRASQYRVRLEMVTQGLKRIKDTSFGRCAECENPIEEKRLQAMPSARYCIRCQEHLEHR